MTKYKMELSNINREIEIEKFDMGFTYSNLLTGKPDLVINECILDGIKPPSDWPFYSKWSIPIPPDLKLSRMPECYYHVALTSSGISTEYYFSGLILSWFDEVPGKRTIKEIVEHAVSQISWEEIAGDFDW
jgi:hypothetical protein